MELKKIKDKYKEQIHEAISDLKTKGKRKQQIPNLITASRLLAPLVIIPPALMGNLPLAGILTCCFAATDGVDGFLARKWHATSDLGRDLDAITDKVFAGTLLITLSFSNPALLVTLGFEGAIGAINAYSKSKGNEPRTAIIGKAKTASLSALIVASFANSFVNFPSNVIPFLFGSTTALQAITTATYAKKHFIKEKIKMRKSNEDTKSLIETEEEDKEKVKSKEKTLEQNNSVKDENISLNKTTTLDKIKNYESLRSKIENESKKESKDNNKEIPDKGFSKSMKK